VPRARASLILSAILPRVKTPLAVLAVIALAIIVAVVGFVSINNDLVAREQQVREAWAQVQNVYQRRADLIPNLVETVKGFAAQERTVLEEVTRARASVAGIQVTPELIRDPAALRRFQEAQTQLGGALSRLLVVVERYPELRSNQNFLALQSQLEGTENRIAVERRRYNEAVRAYNTALRTFPRSLVASLRGFQERSYFEATPGSEAAPPVKL
jgi:LemA protein